jgi:DNA-binding GntR family transcriptional regulator
MPAEEGQGSSLGERLSRVGEFSRAEYVHGVLRQEIISGSIRAGTRLSETLLASELSVSRTPVREALRRLQQEGLVVKSSRGGVEVPFLSRKDVAEIIGIRAVLEGYAARLAAEHISDDRLVELRRSHESALRAIEIADVAQLIAENTIFHDGVVAASSSARCTMMVGELRDWILQYRSQILASADAQRRSYAQHGEILDALASRDTEGAEELMRRHIVESMTPVLQVVE